MISSQNKKDLLTIMEKLGIKEEDIIEKFIIGSGRGGQKIQKTSSCVYLKHIPSGIEIKCQQDRSRERNRLLARRELCDKLEQVLLGEKSRKRQEIEKLRRQKRRRSKRAQEKILASKKHRSELKKTRQTPS